MKIKVIRCSGLHKTPNGKWSATCWNEDDGWQLAEAVVTGMHFPPVRASGYPYAGVWSLRKPVNNTASQQAADQTFTKNFSENQIVFVSPGRAGTGPTGAAIDRKTIKN